MSESIRSSGRSVFSGSHPPPLPPLGSGSDAPQLLPSEVLLENFGEWKSKFEPSGWIHAKKRAIQLDCRQCNLLCQLHPWVVTQSFVTSENDVLHLKYRCYRGRLYLTSERLVFVPRDQANSGYSLFIDQIDMLKIIRDFKDRPYLVCYVDDYMAVIPLRTADAADKMFQLLVNIKFEHQLRQHVTPGYLPDEPPCYSASEEALEKFIESVFPGMKRRDQRFKELVRTIGSGARAWHIGGHNGYEIGHKAHAVIYTGQVYDFDSAQFAGLLKLDK